MTMPTTFGTNSTVFAVEKIRAEFPILSQSINNHPLIYFDNAATTQKPLAVINAMQHYYTHDNANVHRGIHTLSERATHGYESARETVRQFINANGNQEIIFTRGSTESINLVANSFVAPMLQENDEVLISYMEHHANIVPWQIICERAKAKLIVIPINDQGELIIDEIPALISTNTKFISIVHMSNALGTINPIKQIIALAKQHAVPILIDGAQACVHLPIDVQDLDCDFYVFSGHKLYGPTGIGVLYGKKHWLELMPPYQAGGEMIKQVSFTKTIFNDLPHKFEAGTPHIAGAIGLAAAINFINGVGFDQIRDYEQQLFQYALSKISTIPELTVVGTAKQRASVISFTLANIHPHDIGTILNHVGIAIRSGHHCAMPVMQRFGISATARISLACYNTTAEIDSTVAAIQQVREVFHHE